jgi:DNA polymerase subunit Cdc27
MVSYKWVARQYDIPANYAKQLLFKLAESQRGKMQATYLLAGWQQDGQGGRLHTVQLVDASLLAREKARFAPLTGLHVYSLQPSQPKVALSARRPSFPPFRLGGSLCLCASELVGALCLGGCLCVCVCVCVCVAGGREGGKEGQRE